MSNETITITVTRRTDAGIISKALELSSIELEESVLPTAEVLLVAVKMCRRALDGQERGDHCVDPRTTRS